MALLRNLQVLEVPLLLGAWLALFVALPCLAAWVARSARSLRVR